MSSTNGIKVKLNRRRSSLSTSFTQSPHESPGVRQKQERHKRAVREKRDLLFQRNRHINETELDDEANESQKPINTAAEGNKAKNSNVKKSFIARFQNLINAKVKIAAEAMCSTKHGGEKENDKSDQATVNKNMKRSQSVIEEKVDRIGMKKQFSARSIGTAYHAPPLSKSYTLAHSANILKEKTHHSSNVSLSSNDSKNSSGFGLGGSTNCAKPVFKVSRAIKYDDKYLYQQNPAVTRKSINLTNSPRSSPRK